MSEPDRTSVFSMLDLSAVQANSTRDQVRRFAETAARYNCKAVFALSSFLPTLHDFRREFGGSFLIGGTVGFPSGGMTTEMKIREAECLLKLGVDEVDMMINVGYLLSGLYEEAEEDIRAVKKTVGDTPLKVILECHYLDATLIQRAAEMAVQAGAQWVKTGTGWTPTGATLENVALIKETVGDRAKVKASGGVRNLETLQKMIALGVERFGVGSAVYSIIKELEA